MNATEAHHRPMLQTAADARAPPVTCTSEKYNHHHKVARHGVISAHAIGGVTNLCFWSSNHVHKYERHSVMQPQSVINTPLCVYCLCIMHLMKLQCDRCNIKHRLYINMRAQTIFQINKVTVPSLHVG